ncbi:unnamed protein product [Bursaphelenchus okinawaensis]|uniref:Phosphatidate cytidylyltransferase n=1 Tax=Bursaphelenchus okinawaensis TaxID=465554 RepID=A0A811KT77_9BILA|nr:unnamed protein product [Bursaphelenchus okinawaensis]CAG9109650.1 unnamed protein product [Bursaphelenchus okinawaensis]
MAELNSPIGEGFKTPSDEDFRGPDLRKRKPKTAATSDESEEDVDKIDERLDDIKKHLPQGSDSMGSYVDGSLNQLSPRWRNWVVRGIFSIVMIGAFTLVVNKGGTWLMGMVFLIQMTCFYEIISIGLYVYRLYDLPWFRGLSWWFLITSNYFFFGESLIDYWSIVLRKDEFLRYLVVYHRVISFSLYCVGFVWFVLSLRKGLYLRQFSLFAYTHVALLLIVTQSFLIVQNLLQGLVWFLLPVSMIICCDIMSYIFGFFFGRTPLIKLSPKKTWEGFIGGAFSTVIFGVCLASTLVNNKFYVCPVESYYENNMNCTLPLAFVPQEYEVPRQFAFVFKVLKRSPVVTIAPFILHVFVLALFASLIAPFGGFFASGFKRAFKIKDFGAIIPGHGGLMDRFDCQLLMGTFVYAYIHSIIRFPNWNKVVQHILWLPVDEQLAIYETLQRKLIENGVLPGL